MLLKKPIYTAILLLLTAGCKQGDEPVPQVQVSDLLNVDYSGEWNGYKYIDYAGLVPLEIIRIAKRHPDSTYYIATKVKGDNGVPGGAVTWMGDISANPFSGFVNYSTGSGRFQMGPMTFYLINENTIITDGNALVFVRRTSGHFK